MLDNYVFPQTVTLVENKKKNILLLTRIHKLSEQEETIFISRNEEGNCYMEFLYFLWISGTHQAEFVKQALHFFV